MAVRGLDYACATAPFLKEMGIAMPEPLPEDILEVTKPDAKDLHFAKNHEYSLGAEELGDALEYKCMAEGENYLHSVYAQEALVKISDVEEMDMWSPRRDDWLDGTDNYLRG